MGPKPSRWNLLAALALLGAVSLHGCGADFAPGSDTDLEVADSTGNAANRGFIANFDLSKGLVPSANNLLFSGSLDGTLNIPVAPTDSAGTQALKATLNALDGFSTVAPVSTSFSLAVDAATLGPSTVQVFEVSVDPDPAKNRAVTGVSRALAFGAEFVAAPSSVDPTGKTVAIVPLRALKPKTTYMVALFEGIRSADGRPVLPADQYLTVKTVPNDLTGTPAAALEPVRRLVQAQEAALAAFGVDPEPVVLSWTFTTQSVGDVLSVVRSRVPAAPATALAFTGASTPLGAASIYAGTLEVPYYLAAATGPNDPTPLQTTWSALNEVAGARHLTRFNPLPEVRSTRAIPLLLTVPKTGSAPWPVVVFQHGITSNRTALLGIADALAGAGFAAVSIDLPLHGLTGKETDGTQAFRLAGAERTFDLDLVNNATGAPGPDGVTDASGTHFINLTSLLTSRDNLRQGAADLFALTKALETLDYNGGGADLDPSEVYFVGHSLGAMVGTAFLALEPGVRAAVLGMPGGGIAKLLDGSGAFGPRIAAGLAANGVVKGTSDYESFMAVAQAAVDSADPLNHAAGAVAGRGLLLFEVVGDLVVPNNVLPTNPVLAPGTVPSALAGTDPLVRALGLTQVGETTPAVGTSPAPLLAWVGFSAGDHSSLLKPTVPAVTGVMQGATVAFLVTDGGQVAISDPSVVLGL